MSATITWKVGTLECYPTYQEEKDVVFTVHWDCLGSEIVNGVSYNGRVYGSNAVTYHSGSEFTPYELLTESQVLGWIWESMGVSQKENVEAGVQNQINNQINPPVVILPLPWIPPGIVQQPQNVSIEISSSATFTVVASGPDGLTYQWMKNGIDISGATSSSYTINQALPSDEGTYSVKVSTPNGQSVTSNTATLTVVIPPPPPVPVPPTIVVPPVSQTTLTGDPASFNVNASGDYPLTYQWMKNGMDITDAITNTYSIASVTLTDAGNYTVTITNSAGSVTSNPVTLTVTEPQPAIPVITEQPSSQTVIVGDGVVFNVNATGDQPIAYQWFKDDVEIQGATGNTHIIQTSALTDAGNYKATVTNIAGTVTSNTATLTVNEPTP